jgi:hypothetical protein
MSTTSETKDSEIDEQVAKEVFGWERVRIDQCTSGWKEPDGYVNLGFVFFSTDTTRAFEVVGKLREMKLDISIAIQSHHKRWEVDMYGGSPHVLASFHDESLPRAICRCALEVVRAMRGPNAEE